MTKRGWVLLVLLALAAVFAFEASEHSTPQWLALRRKERTARTEVDSLARVDRVARVRKLVESDPARQERIAREQYGMLRKGEIEFTVVR